MWQLDNKHKGSKVINNQKSIYFRIICLIILLALNSSLLFADSKKRRISKISVQVNPRLGLAFPGSNPKYYYVLKEAGLGVVRLGVNWKTREPREGTYDWRGLDKRINRLQELGIEPFLTLYSDAKWGVYKETFRKVKNATPKNLRKWARFVSSVVERYDNDGKNDMPQLRRAVRYYQVANEWMSPSNKSGGWASTANELIDFINTSHDAVKLSYPRARFVLGGIASFNLDLMALFEDIAHYKVQQKISKNRLVLMTSENLRSSEYKRKAADVYNVLSKTKFDFADIHLYGKVDRIVPRISSVLKHIKKVPLLSSECGGPSLDYRDTYRPEEHFRAVFEWNLAGLNEGLEFCLWFGLGEGNGSTWGNRKVALFDRNKKPKPGYWAYKLLAALLKDMKKVVRIAPGQYLVYRVKAEPLLIAWKTDNSEGDKFLHLKDVIGLYTAKVLQIVNAKKGFYVINDLRSSRSIKLTSLPLIAGKSLPKELFYTK